jgi:hypothetical protein
MTRNLLLLAHIASVAAWLGANFVQFVVAPRFRRAGGDTAQRWTDTAQFLGQRYYNVVGVLVAVTGVALVLHGEWHWQGFVLIGIAMVVIGGVTGVAILEPLLKRETAARSAGDEAAVARIQHNFNAVAALDTLLVLVTMLAMIDRWHGSPG